VTLCGQVYHMQKLGHPFLSGLVRIALEKIPALAVAAISAILEELGRRAYLFR
jgi:hypothetical protein